MSFSPIKRLKNIFVQKWDKRIISSLEKMKIKELTYELNVKSIAYEIGNLQSIRKNIKGLKKRAGNSIFADNTTYDNYAFHYGGRSEIQFNIGTEEEGIRYGLAFSLEPSQSLPYPSILFPKILKLNCLVREQPEFFKPYRMWYYIKDERSEITDVVEIRQELLNSKIFIFFGNISAEDKINVNDILQTFDDLLWVYKTIETVSLENIKLGDDTKSKDFIFDNKSRSLAKKVAYTTQEIEVDIDIRHSYLQELLQMELIEKYGDKNVSLENPLNGNKIDLVLKYKDGFHFYEVKTASSASACVRQAVGQLLEYGYGNCKKNATKLFVAGEFPVDNETSAYLSYLRSEFKLPIFYKMIETLKNKNAN